MMTRILHLIPGLTGGGAEAQLALLAPQQAALGHDVHIAFISGDIPQSLLNNASIHMTRLAHAGHHDPALAVRIASLIRSSAADVVHTWILLMDVLGGAAALLAHKPWIVSERSDANNYPPSLKTRTRRTLGKRANAIIANSAGGVRYWMDQGVPPHRIAEIGNAVDLDGIRAAPDAILPDRHARQPIVLFVGRLSAEKNPLVFIESMVEVASSTNALGVVCGTGAMAEQVQKTIVSHGLSHRILMLGQTANVAGLLRKANACVAVSQYEGSPNVVLEAMAAGCPLIVSDIPAYRHLLDDEQALFVPVGDAGETAEAIMHTLANPLAARARAERALAGATFRTPAAIASEIDEVYRSVLRQAR